MDRYDLPDVPEGSGASLQNSSEQLFEGRRRSRPLALRVTLLPLVVGVVIAGVTTFFLLPTAREASLSVRADCERGVWTTVEFRSAFPIEHSPGEDPLLARAVYAPPTWPKPASFLSGDPATGPLVDEAETWLAARRDASFTDIRRLTGDRESALIHRESYSTLAGGDLRIEIAFVDLDGSVIDATTNVRCEPMTDSKLLPS